MVLQYEQLWNDPWAMNTDLNVFARVLHFLNLPLHPLKKSFTLAPSEVVCSSASVVLDSCNRSDPSICRLSEFYSKHNKKLVSLVTQGSIDLELWA